MLIFRFCTGYSQSRLENYFLQRAIGNETLDDFF